MNLSAKFVPVPSRPPPASAVGVQGWLRAHLFSSPLNIAITAVIAYFLFLIIPPAIKWLFIDAVWSGSESAGCKTTLDNGAVADAYGACWTFVRVRIEQILFGVYYAANPDQLWRPILVFVLIACQITLLLTEKFSYKLHLGIFVIFIFPFIAFALVHGEWLGLPVAETDRWGGFMLTFFLASVGIVAALPIGIAMALGRRSDMPIIRSLCIFYIELWRAAPLITILFMASNLLPLFVPSGVHFDKVMRAMIAITLFQSAYTAEAIRGGLQAIPKGQYEAAEAMGMGYWKKTGFIILPQALKISIPGIVNTFIALFKDTTLVSVIGLLDFLGMTQAASRSPQWKGYELEGYVFVAFIFFLCCFSMSRYSQALERKLHTGHQKR